MKNVIEILEKQYQSFINQKNDWNFFLSLADYLDFVEKDPVFNKAINKIKKNQKKELDILRSLDQKAIIELKAIRKIILQFFKGKKISKKIERRLKELTNFKINTHSGYKYFAWQSRSFDSKIKEIMEFLWSLNYKHLINKILAEVGAHCSEERKEVSFSAYQISPSEYEKSFSKEQRIKEKAKIDLWGAYSKLRLFEITLSYLRSEEYPEIFKGFNWAKEMFDELAYEIQIIQNDSFDYEGFRINPNFSSSSDQRIKSFKKNKYQLYISRIHNYLIVELSKEKKQQGGKSQTKKTKTEYTNGVLCFQEKKIDFNRKDNQKFLLDAMFKEPTKNWFYDELQEIWDEDPNAKLGEGYWRKFYTAGDGINNAIEKKTQIENFIKKNTKQIRINLKYI